MPCSRRGGKTIRRAHCRKNSRPVSNKTASRCRTVDCIVCGDNCVAVSFVALLNFGERNVQTPAPQTRQSAVQQSAVQLRHAERKCPTARRHSTRFKKPAIRRK